MHSLHSLNDINTHHHLLLSKPILEELVDSDSGLDRKQIGDNKHHSLHKFEIVKVDGLWVDLLGVEIVSDLA